MPKFLYFLYSIVFWRILVKKEQKIEKMNLWRSLIPVSNMLVLWKLLGLIVSIMSIDVSTLLLWQVFPVIFAEVKKSQRSSKKLVLSFLLSDMSMLRLTITIVLSYYWHIDLKKDLIHWKIWLWCYFVIVCKQM